MTKTTFDIAFAKVKELVAVFKANEAHYLSAEYPEARARIDFVDKFWQVLGWDVNHDVQTNPYEQEVKVERGLEASGQRRTDYAFCLAPNFRDVRFYVEAKKPSAPLATSDFYFQVIRYGWNSQTPLAVLSNFAQLHVLDCRYKPDIDTVLNRAVSKYTYLQYANRDEFSKIYWLFSREAVVDGSIEKRTAELRETRGKAVQRGLFPGGYQSIDESFLTELDEYRTALAHAFKSKNPRLDSETLTEITQRTLDRLVFLRFLEDKGIELNRLVEKFGDKGTAWEDFIAASHRLDSIYNGIVFKPHAILDAPGFRMDDNAFADVCESIAHINSPYDFNAIPIHILGSIYERFLGKVIIATGKRVRVEDKPQVRKAGGVYYTPEYIVRYIVENTVGKLIDGKLPEQIEKMRFADIACGSGSFLLGIYDLLLNYHGNYYNALDADDRARCIKRRDCVERDGKLYLSLGKRRKILLNNIYGVDIDAQAFEVAQLSLYLKLLQTETPASTHQYELDFVHTEEMRKLLPDLSKNIVCGNSLIGTDILEGQLFPSDEERKLNPMNFEDAFPEVMKRGGFDAIVGNPPWGSFFTNIEKKYLYEHYVNRRGEAESHLFFIERACRLITNVGIIGFITPNTWLAVLNSREIRKFLLENMAFREVCELSKFIFNDAPDIIPILLFLSRKRAISMDCTVKRATVIKVEASNFDKVFSATTVPQDIWTKSQDTTINLRASSAVLRITDKCKDKGVPLGDICDILYGIKTGDNRKYISNKRTKKYAAKALKTGELVRYWITWKGVYLWWCKSLAGYRVPSLEVPKVIVQYIRKISLPRRIIAALDIDGIYYPLNNYSYITLKNNRYPLYYVLGILNSSLINFYFANTYIDYNIKPTYLQRLPVFRINFASSTDQIHQAKIVQKVEAMLEAKKQLARARTDKDKTYYKNKCASIDRQIDRLVYELYELTDEEIALVEQDNPNRR